MNIACWKFGFAKFLEVYREECEWQGMICDGFEKEAIQNIKIPIGQTVRKT